MEHCDIHNKEKQAQRLQLGNFEKITYVCVDCIQDRRRENEQREALEKEQAQEHRVTDVYKKAGITKRNWLKEFDNYLVGSKEQALAVDKCKQFVNQYPDVGNLLLLGGVGTGKTHLASAVVKGVIAKRKYRFDARIIKCIDLIRQLKASWSNKNAASEIDLIKQYATIPLLVIDEIGVQFGSETEKLFLFDIIDGRYQNMLPTILISNLGVSALSMLIGERCLDRLREDGGHMVAFDWESYRKTASKAV